MYKTTLLLEGSAEEIEAELRSLGNTRRPLDPRRVLRPPSAKELARKKGGPPTVAEWKRRSWGTESLECAKPRRSGGQAFLEVSSEGCPAPLVRAILRSHPCVRGAVSVSRDGSDVRGWTERGSWRGVGEALRRQSELRGAGLWETLQSHLRFGARLRSRDREVLQSGGAVQAELPWGQATLQRDFFNGPWADFVFDDTEPLDDVLLARCGDAQVWIDLEFL